jgi:hypothetical protein
MTAGFADAVILGGSAGIIHFMHAREVGLILTDRIIGPAINMHRALGPACWRPSITIASAGNSSTPTPHPVMVRWVVGSELARPGRLAAALINAEFAEVRRVRREH